MSRLESDTLMTITTATITTRVTMIAITRKRRMMMIKKIIRMTVVTLLPI